MITGQSSLRSSMIKRLAQFAFACALVAVAACTPAPSTTGSNSSNASGFAALKQDLSFVPPAPNGSPFLGVQDPPAITASGKRTFDAPLVVIDVTHTYCAIIKTDKGRMVAQLYPKAAPINVNGFTFLANQGYYDGITWHRVLADFMAQTGDPDGTGAGGPGYLLPLEMHPNVKYSQAGVIGVARTQDPNSAGSQFFITYAPQSSLDPGGNGPGYTIIGQLVDGLTTLRQLRIRDPNQQPTYVGDALVSVRVVDLGVK